MIKDYIISLYGIIGFYIKKAIIIRITGNKYINIIKECAYHMYSFYFQE
jgi:hypothetical protein